MIPKTIHYCWFGRQPKPPGVLTYIATWRAAMPDYDIIEWNEDNFDIDFCDYSREAYATRNFAFVADVCRLKVLYEHGGIYLDTDIEVLRPFDPYLHHRSFCGYENRWIGTGVIGAEMGCHWIGIFLDYYRTTHFIDIFGHAVRKSNTRLLTTLIMPKIQEDQRPEIYPIDYFCAKNWETHELAVTPNTVSIHHYACSWAKKKRSLLARLRMRLQGLHIRYFSRPSH